MSATSKIEWTDTTWNPTRGCSIVSPGCVNCYAMKQAHRFSGPGRAYEGLTKLTERSGPQWSGTVRTVQDALLEPLSWRKPRRVFVNSMSDLFHEDVPDSFIDKVFAVMALAEWHTFQILTKRAERMRAYMTRLDRDVRLPDTTHPRWKSEAEGILDERRDWNTAVTSAWPLPNVWLGVSAEDQQRYDQRIGHLLRTPAEIRFVSAEPLIGPVDFRMGGMSLPDYSAHDPLPLLNWVIVGGESGPGARAFDLAWARSIVEQCESAGVPCFVKQLGAKPLANAPPGDARRWILDLSSRKGGDSAEWPEDLRVREFPKVRR